MFMTVFLMGMNVCLEIGVSRIKHFMARSFVLQCYMSSHIRPGVELSGRDSKFMIIIKVCNRVLMFGEVAVIAFVFVLGIEMPN
jgi:hypothetical protein